MLNFTPPSLPLCFVFLARGSVDLLEDVELQNWRNELADPMEDGGLGLVGVPLGKARVRTLFCVCFVYPTENGAHA